MANPWKLPDELIERISKLASDLGGEVQELRDTWDERSESWQQSDKGNDVLAWVDELGDLADTLDALDTQAPS